MISPLGQRQILQTAAVETVRQAMEGGFQVQREQARKQAFDAKLVEALVDVADVSETDAMKLTEHGAQDQPGHSRHGTGASEARPSGQVDGLPAAGAEQHLDLLA
jgi:hypothetical protein